MVTTIERPQTRRELATAKLLYRVTGISPLLMHNPAGSMTGNKARKEIPPPEEEAERAAYRLPSGQLYIKSEAFIGSMRRAASGFKVPSRYGKESAKAVISGGLTPQQEVCVLVHPETGEELREYVVDIRRAVVQGNGVLRARPRLDLWGCVIEFEYFQEQIGNVDIITMIFERAGLTVGVGDQRPGAPKTPGAFGKYRVELLAHE